MKLTILIDSEIKPMAFYWLGRIEKDKFNNWLKELNFILPDDLKEFFEITGGGTAFESEEFLCPMNIPIYESDFSEINKSYQMKGLPKDYIIFQLGVFLSAIRLSDQKYVLLEKNNYTVISEFISFNEWYANTIRDEFAVRYGLA
ncbi:MAG: SMI1/KNR4 family protein [Ignavibacteriaceae bacterium]